MTEIDELRQEVRRLGKLVEETHADVRNMRRSQRLHTVMQWLWWAAVLAVSAYVYYVYAAPYIEQIMRLYGNVQGFQEQAADFFSQYR